MTMFRRLLVGTVALFAVSIVVVATANAAAVVPPQGKVGPHQIFGGLVNGQRGIGSPAPIRMACFGAVRPGETGHPMSGQTVEVFRPEAIVGHFGYTGSSATHIVAFFGPLPPTPVVVPPTASTVTFTKYAVKKPIPTSLRLPCAGTGSVTFVPLPQSPPSSRDATVPVRYQGQP
jgi:hypothetical protein